MRPVILGFSEIFRNIIAERLAILHNDVAALNVVKKNIGELLLLLRQHGKTSVKLILRRAVTMEQPQILVKMRVHIVRVNLLRVYRRDMGIDVIRHISTAAAFTAGKKLLITSHKGAISVFIKQKDYLLSRLLRKLVFKALPREALNLCCIKIGLSFKNNLINFFIAVMV